ncbi:unnamed protein product [Arabidopsis arenosa]|uniref:Cystatin domain-containing protein n=1 Tax=Arabidopsis arenosa TaxID=38785 RepID=A0A8S2APJ8_ARAAE|nr:unnamed protein product [Arabidopsis arenosa]
MASGSSKTNAQTAQIASTAAEPIETTTDESTVSSSLNKDRSDSETKEDDYSSDGNEYSAESDEEEEGEDYESNGEEEEDEDDCESNEEEDDDNESNDKERDGEDDEDSIVDDGDSTSDQPEWGVDDFDDIYSDFYSPDEDCYTDEEDERKKRLYRRNLHFSHGFLVEKGIRPRSVWSGAILLEPLDSEHSPVKGRTQLQYAQDMVKLSLRKYNALNETNVTLDHIVRVTGSFTGRWVSYITFMAKESEDDDTLVEYQAKVVKKLRCKTYPMFCRPSPKLDPDM